MPLDVRVELARIEGSPLIPTMPRLEERFSELDPDSETVVIRHHGTRSAYFAQTLAFQRQKKNDS